MKIPPGTPMLAVHACGAAGVLAISGAVALLSVRPAVQRADEMRAVFTSINERDRDAKAAQEAATKLVRVNEDLRDELAKAVKLVPATKINERLSELTARADGRSVSVEQITPGTPAAGAKFVTIPIRMSGSCTYSSLTRFLRELRTNMRDTAVTSLQVVGHPEKGGEKAAYVIEFVWYAAPAVSAGATVQP